MGYKDNTSILIDLDSVLDTRHPVLYALHEPTAVNVVESEYYQRRVKDVFGCISYDIFKHFYNKRNKNVLKLALPTPMLELLKEYCLAAYAEAVSSKDPFIPTLYINIYPYDLNKGEVKNLIVLFNNSIPVNMNIELINLSDLELTPRYVTSIATTFIKYNMLEWLEMHSGRGTLVKAIMLNVTCVAPMLANGNKSTRDLRQEDFEQLIYAMSAYTTLLPLKTRLFSIP